MFKRLIEETALFSQVFTPDIGPCISYHFSLINGAVSSVNRSVSLVLTKRGAWSYVTRPLLCRNEEEKRCPSVLHREFAGIVEPTMSRLQLK